MLNISYKKVGGLRFLKLGRLTFMFCLSKQFKPLPTNRQAAIAAH